MKIPLAWPSSPLDAEQERLWLRVFAEHVARRLAADIPPERPGIRTGRAVSRRDIRDAILDSAEWETEPDNRLIQLIQLRAQCAVRDEWAADTGNEGGWRRVRIRLTAEPANKGAATALTIQQEDANEPHSRNRN